MQFEERRCVETVVTTTVVVPELEGHCVQQVRSEYWGNHPERCGGDEFLYLAVPPGVAVPPLAHGSAGTRQCNAAALRHLPIFVWEDDQWVAAAEWAEGA